MSFKDWLVQLLASRWVMPDPRVAEATLQQRNVTGDTHSRKVDARAFEWQAAEACAERGLYGAPPPSGPSARPASTGRAASSTRRRHSERICRSLEGSRGRSPWL